MTIDELAETMGWAPRSTGGWTMDEMKQILDELREKGTISQNWENPPKETPKEPKEGDIRIHLEPGKHWGWWWAVQSYSKENSQVPSWQSNTPLEWKTINYQWKFCPSKDYEYSSQFRWSFTKKRAMLWAQSLIDMQRQREARAKAEKVKHETLTEDISVTEMR